ncbi:MAG: DegT/DnrJ/EryC1/StrS family aminotransferase [Actinomycetota bacterium]|nr:DegT/DnrJ/EryC1/StrS family aminotransferase [Actinomycetota bacterium]
MSTELPVPISSPGAQVRALGEPLREAIEQVLQADRFILGPNLAALEHEFADFIGTAHSVGVANGTEAIALTLKALGVGSGDEVITVAHTALATVAAIVMTGARPVLVDVDPATMVMDTSLIDAAVTDRTKAVLPVHLYGRAIDLEPIANICERRGLALIEDCSQAHGAYLPSDSSSQQRVGSRGVVGIFSCYPTKNLGALGDAALITTNDSSLAQRITRLRQYGWDEAQVSHEPGWNSRLDELQASVLRVKLRFLDAGNQARQAIALRYDHELVDLDLQLPPPATARTHVQHLYVIQARERDQLRTRLGDLGIGTGVHYALGAHQHPGYADACSFTSLPVTEAAAHRVLSLPMFPELTDEQVDRVVAAVRACA